MRELKYGDIQVNANHTVSVKASEYEATLLVFDLRKMDIVCALAGTEEELAPYRKKYSGNPRYEVSYSPEPAKSFGKEYDGPVYSKAGKAAWDKKNSGFAKDFVKACENSAEKNRDSYFDLSARFGVSDLKEQAQIMYSLVFCQPPVHDPEIAVFNRTPKYYDPRYVMPMDAHSLIMGCGRPIVPFKTFFKELKRQQTAAIATVDFERETGEKVRCSLSLLAANDSDNAFVFHVANNRVLKDGADSGSERIVIGDPVRDDLPAEEMSQIATAVCDQLEHIWKERFPKAE